MAKGTTAPILPEGKKLLAIKEKLDNGLISVEIAEELRREVLGLPPLRVLAPASTPTAVQLEDQQLSSEKKIEAVIAAWFGSPEAPVINGLAYEAFMGRGETSIIREGMDDLATADRLWKMIAAEFRAVPPNTTPLAFLGDIPQAKIARAAAWRFLAEIGTLVGTELTMRGDTREARQEFRATLALCFEKEEGTVVATHLRAAVTKLVRTQKTTSSAPPKRARDEAAYAAPKKRFCSFCRRPGHDVAECRLKKDKEAHTKKK